MTQGLAEYVDLKCEDENMIAVSEVTPGMESTQFTPGVYKGMPFQQALNSFPNEYQMCSNLAKHPKDIAMLLM